MEREVSVFDAAAVTGVERRGARSWMDVVGWEVKCRREEDWSTGGVPIFLSMTIR